MATSETPIDPDDDDFDREKAEDDAAISGENKVAALLAKCLCRGYLKYLIAQVPTEDKRSAIATRLRVSFTTIDRWLRGPVLPSGEFAFALFSAYPTLSLEIDAKTLDQIKDDANNLAISVYRHKLLGGGQRKENFLLLTTRERKVLNEALKFQMLPMVLAIGLGTPPVPESKDLLVQMNDFVKMRPPELSERESFLNFLRLWLPYAAHYNRNKPEWA